MGIISSCIRPTLGCLAIIAALAAVCAGAGADAGTDPTLPLHVTKDWQSGRRDAKGQFMAGTETMRLLGYQGRLYASLSEWMDVPYGKAKGDNPWTGPEVLVKESADGPWRVEIAFGPEYMRTEALVALPFTTDAAGKPLAAPMSMLVAAPGYLASEELRSVSIWTRDDGSGAWTKAEITIAGMRRHGWGVRSFGSHVDRITRIHHAFAGISMGYILRGAYDAAAAGRIRWDPEPELGGTGRIMAFAECNGALYAACGMKDADHGGLYRRKDGPQPAWEQVYRWPFTRMDHGDEANIMRGLTAIADPSAPGRQVLLGTRHVPGVVERIDPGKGHAVSAELDIKARFAKEWGVPEVRGPALAAYNDMLPFHLPDGGEPVLLIGVWVNHPEHRHPPYNGGKFLIRRQDGSYACGLVYDAGHPLAAGRGLVATRTIEVSPFPEDRGRVLYFGGYDCADVESHNTAWIYKGSLERR